MKTSLIYFLLIVTWFTVNVSLANGLDVITMNNGDVHNGVIDNKTFSIKTAFGEVVVPYINIAELHLSHQPYQDSLLTHEGDYFIGDIQGSEVIILRTLDPVLPVAFDGIAEIHFSKKTGGQNIQNNTGVLASRFGDVFSINLLADAIEITMPEQPVSIAIGNIYTIDVARLMDGEEIVVQVRTTDDRVYQGKWLIKNLTIETAYQQTLTLNPEDLSSLTFKFSDKTLYKQAALKLNWQSFNYFTDQLADRTSGPELVKLNAARYMRGDDAGDDDEKPAMPINIKAFAIGSHEVTFAQYDKFCDDVRRSAVDDDGWGRGSRPVMNVSWIDALAYTQWLSRKTQKKYRLPTDAEWEYAARAGSLTRFWWGDEVGVAMANCEGCESIWGGEKTSPVGRFLPNQFGLYDTAGNVFEWVADCYHNTFEHAPTDGSAIDKPGCGKRVIRGGAWSFPATESRSANRWRDFPTRRSDDTGFRVLRELD